MSKISSLVLTVGIACLAGSVWAQSPTVTQSYSKIAVISVQGVIAGTKDGQKAIQELNSKYGPKQKEMQARQNEIRQLNEQLQKTGNQMSQDKRDELSRQVDQKTKRFQRDAQDAQEEVQQDQQRLLGAISQRLMPLIEKYAKDKGYTLVLDVSSPNTPVMYAASSNDITKDIIALYDQAPATTPTGAPAGSPTPGTSVKPPSSGER
jgi:outer membrane protein